jgi:hypothetical protein
LHSTERTRHTEYRLSQKKQCRISLSLKIHKNQSVYRTLELNSIATPSGGERGEVCVSAYSVNVRRKLLRQRSCRKGVKIWVWVQIWAGGRNFFNICLFGERTSHNALCVCSFVQIKRTRMRLQDYALLPSSTYSLPAGLSSDVFR